MKLLIAIDDTDNLESIGTGRLARYLADELMSKGLVARADVTRHQFLIHPDIPYTSHNSGACICGHVTKYDDEEIFSAAREFLIRNFHKGANPGLCVARQSHVPRELAPFGQRAQHEVIELDEAKHLAEELGILAWWNGETGQGCIGAMAGIGLRSTGNDGRYISLRGIRDIKGVVKCEEILESTNIERVADVSSGVTLDGDELVDTQDWVRPSLLNGEVVLMVSRTGDTWSPAEKKKRKS